MMDKCGNVIMKFATLYDAYTLVKVYGDGRNADTRREAFMAFSNNSL